MRECHGAVESANFTRIMTIGDTDNEFRNDESLCAGDGPNFEPTMCRCQLYQEYRAIAKVQDDDKPWMVHDIQVFLDTFRNLSCAESVIACNS